MTKSELHVYSARFEPNPLVGVRFANPDIVEEFEAEMMGRWESLQEYLDVFAETPDGVYECSSENGINLWQHVEGGLITPIRSGLYLPPKPYALVGCYGATLVANGAGIGIDYEMEVLFAVADYEPAVDDVKKVMEADLPSNIIIGQVRRLYAEDAGGIIHAGIRDNLTKASNFRQN